MRIVQITPFIGPGSGVAGVAWQLEREFRAAGVDAGALTYTPRGRPGRRWRWPDPASRFGRRVQRARDVVSFSVFGTVGARRYLTEHPDVVAICHSEALAGDIFVSHGVETVAVQTRKRGWWLLAAYPVRAFTYLRERHRYRSHVHEVVVVLSEAEAAALDSAFGPVTPAVEIIPNGVDLDKFRPPSPAERAAARESFLLTDDARVALLIGHDLLRKGALTAVDALIHAPSMLLLIVGGDAESIEATRARAARNGVEARIHFVGVRQDVSFLMAAADVFLFPSSYEANALVVLEALACGLPVICTPVGYAAEIVDDGVNGWLVPPDAESIGARLEEAAGADLGALRRSARASVEGYGWAGVAQRYIALAERIAERRGAAGAAA
jgi:UDP-glucose:(heptosyl)LPS alpha-1,3-glucosyltransferase